MALIEPIDGNCVELSKQQMQGLCCCWDYLLLLMRLHIPKMFLLVQTEQHDLIFHLVISTFAFDIIIAS